MLLSGGALLIAGMSLFAGAHYEKLDAFFDALSGIAMGGGTHAFLKAQAQQRHAKLLRTFLEETYPAR